MTDPEDVQLDEDELEALRGVAANVQAIPTNSPKLSQKALDHGLVTRNADGVLEITAKGKRVLRAG